jgi:hypothetical protein
LIEPQARSDREGKKIYNLGVQRASRIEIAPTQRFASKGTLTSAVVRERPGV